MIIIRRKIIVASKMLLSYNISFKVLRKRKKRKEIRKKMNISKRMYSKMKKGKSIYIKRKLLFLGDGRKND